MSPTFSRWGLRQILLFVLLTVSATTASADEILQFGVIFPTSFQAGAPLQPANGYSIHTFVVVNLGTTPFNVSDLLFTSSITSTTTPVNPDVSANIIAGFFLAPGQAAGYINGDFNQPLTLTYVQSIFPTITSLTVDPSNGLFANFSNPIGSGVVFQDTQTTVAYQLGFAGADTGWTTGYQMGFPNLQSGFTAGSLGYAVSNVVVIPSPVPEPSTLGLMGAGLIGLWLNRKRKSP